MKFQLFSAGSHFSIFTLRRMIVGDDCSREQRWFIGSSPVHFIRSNIRGSNSSWNQKCSLLDVMKWLRHVVQQSPPTTLTMFFSALWKLNEQGHRSFQSFARSKPSNDEVHETNFAKTFYVNTTKFWSPYHHAIPLFQPPRTLPIIE
jgi:hypothetical protein